MSQLVPNVLLLGVEVLLRWVAAEALLDSACVSVGSLRVVAGSGPPTGVSCCSSTTGFSLCLSWLPVYCCWHSRGPAGVNLVACVLLLVVEVQLG